MKRDLKADLEWVRKATKVAQNAPSQALNRRLEHAFVEKAREGWPHAIERAIRVETLLRDILPMVMWELCMYKDHPEANPTTHCCDWNEVVERIQEVLR